ncbi:MAG: hypothetical protein QOF76_5328 [Solirubrobacteraceae bacterium]|jgi:hypothetical protein|nr:hypothetical protein [Solirubrobacteraceae bacterium]
MALRWQRAFAWCGPVLMVFFLLGFGPIAKFLPPPSPHDSVAHTASFYADNATRIHLGLWITTFAAALFAPWVVAITMQMRRIEGRSTPLSFLQLALGAIFVLEFIFPLMIWQAAAFRPGSSPEITARLNDLGWLMFVGVVSTGVLQAIVIGLGILFDEHDEPVFPRWVGYVNLWCALLFMPGGLCVFFKSGPFAYNGLLAWWLLLVGFAVWMIVMSVALLRYAIPHEERAEPAVLAFNRQLV